MRPLEGIKVVTFEHAIAAPFCTRQLADLGARVIKVERPGVGDFARGYDERVHGLASHFVWTNRSKESLTLDVKQAQAQEIVHSLLAGADVFVQNLAPGATQRLGLDYEALRERYPRLIVCDISGYGSDGPYRDKKAYDLLIQSESGFLSVTGTPDEAAKAGCSIADISAGMYAYSNILAALIERGKTGRGRRVDLSMLESMVEWMSFPLYYAFDGQTPPQRNGAAHATIYPYGPFKAGDGKSVMLGLQNEREWKQFCEIVLRQPELADDERFSANSRRVAHRAELGRLIEDVFARLSAQDVIERLEAAKIANAHINDMQAVWAHEQLGARQRWTQVGTPEGAIPALLPPGLTLADEPRMDPVPALGQHTDAILKELGYDEARIRALHEAGAV
ncbi:crotonobetainyl-CoA:carnitine CoA-transferase CaiB-like acyl-CoA transferase [Paraburkholderia bannensis]|uniref:Crotonobetainyl-CoA:carnitine CoA-transferase CaiB-like acyl-CoA transferase n=1 Tax=Paraburkholderia bannensis TaxID=765414 RepID=A0A7W9WW36_9BURK|nr:MULTISPECIES: CaiB/BaiF CoA-transferase family protein [Paraburkholderia]MBB3261432.1 crotonobetainyl-CoA:carnitine CoA-transferase CaiB-like acyl-CoA transferase [Paraburkholderia sp. WP4_3_2]MBB6106394.1 crotonobetainyl-CoA:carnitine CoA-transferase CaiB-like acyl-CoA transferase [Paraburkholderia bannensis]